MPREKPPVGNPLFLKWVEEMRDDAREKGIKSAEVYTKAARSLAACPISYARPRELVCLAGIGAKTVAILEQRWRKHCEDEGLPIPGDSPAPLSAAALCAPIVWPGLPLTTGAKGKARALTRPEDSDDDDDAAAAAPAPKKRKAAKPKPYIPQRGSGGYGILLALVLAIERPELDTRAFLTRGEIVRAAQPYSDASYEHAERGTYFTAWNGMKTLVGKGYVYATGSPQKYCLTEEGYDVAVTLRNLHPDFKHLPKLPRLQDGPLGDQAETSTSPKLLMATNWRTEARQQVTPVSASPGLDRPGPPRGPHGKFEFWYIDARGTRVPDIASAAVRLDPESFVALRKVEFRAVQRDHPVASQLRLVDAAPAVRDGSGAASLFAYIVADEAPPRCSEFGDALAPGEPDGTRGKVGLDAPSTTGRYTHWPTPADDDDDDAIISIINAKRPTPPPVVASPPAPPRALSIARSAPRLSDATTEAGDADAGASSTAPFSPTDAIVFPANSFDIVLILDTREVESRTSRDKIAAALAAKGVRVETRALRLGDMLWVARRRDGLGGEEDECVLDYVVERKRLDDLCSSIRDGRYHEHVYYIVEDWHVAERMEYHGLQIATAKSQLQVINGFYLKETHTLPDTIAFLAALTACIAARHAGSDLHVIPTRCISRATYAGLQRQLRAGPLGDAHAPPPITYLTSFAAYQELNDKSGSRTLRERFARMLLCVRGMSLERVSAVLERYDTPAALWDALKARQARDVDERAQAAATGEGASAAGAGAGKKGKRRGADMFFADEFSGDGRRKIGDALSRDLWKALMGTEHEE